jgi:hypothetical protein
LVPSEPPTPHPPPHPFPPPKVYVGQPSVAESVSILRGLRERYELHHGVRISDSALVEAAVLSDRYVADRWGGLGVRGGRDGGGGARALEQHVALGRPRL